MATHPSVGVPTPEAKALPDIVTGIGTVSGVAVGLYLGADGVTADKTHATIPCMGVAGVAVVIDDAVFVDTGDGAVGTELIHTMHYPGTNPAFRNESPSYQATVTSATAGVPGAFVPDYTPIPADLADLVAIAPTAVPATLWTVGQNVVLGDASTAYWSGTAWTVGVAPA